MRDYEWVAVRFRIYEFEICIQEYDWVLCPDKPEWDRVIRADFEERYFKKLFKC